MLVLLVRLLRIEPPSERQLGAAGARRRDRAGVPHRRHPAAAREAVDHDRRGRSKARRWCGCTGASRTAACWRGRRRCSRAVFVRLTVNPGRAVVSPAERPRDLELVSLHVSRQRARVLRRRVSRAARVRSARSARCGAAGTLLLFFLLNIEIADYYSTGPTLTFNFLSSSLAQDLTYTIGWAVFAIAMLDRRHRAARARRARRRDRAAGRDDLQVLPPRPRPPRRPLSHRVVPRAGARAGDGERAAAEVRAGAARGARRGGALSAAPRARDDDARSRTSASSRPARAARTGSTSTSRCSRTRSPTCATCACYDAQDREVGYLLVPPATTEPRWIDGSMLPIAVDEEHQRLRGRPRPRDERRPPEPRRNRRAVSEARHARRQRRPRALDAPRRRHGLRSAGRRAAAHGSRIRRRATYRYLRVTWDDRSSARVTNVGRASARLSRGAAAEAHRAFNAAFAKRTSEPRKSRYRIDLPGPHLPITAIEVDVAGGNVFRTATVTEPRLGNNEVAPGAPRQRDAAARGARRHGRGGDGRADRRARGPRARSRHRGREQSAARDHRDPRAARAAAVDLLRVARRRAAARALRQGTSPRRCTTSKRRGRASRSAQTATRGVGQRASIASTARGAAGRPSPSAARSRATSSA